jgi:hypothetical protein
LEPTVPSGAVVTGTLIAVAVGPATFSGVQ